MSLEKKNRELVDVVARAIFDRIRLKAMDDDQYNFLTALLEKINQIEFVEFKPLYKPIEIPDSWSKETPNWKKNEACAKKIQKILGLSPK